MPIRPLARTTEITSRALIGNALPARAMMMMTRGSSCKQVGARASVVQWGRALDSVVSERERVDWRRGARLIPSTYGKDLVY